MATRRRFTAASFVCPECGKGCESAGGLKQHRNSHVTLATVHPVPNDLPRRANSPLRSPGPEPSQSPPPQPIVPPVQQGTIIERHPILDGNDLPPGALPPPWEERAADDYSPFESRAEFTFAEFLYVREEMSANAVDHLAQLLAALYEGTDPPFADHKDLYATIDAIQQGDIPWECFSVKYTVWFRSPLGIFEKQLANPDFKDEMDWAPKRIFKNGKRQFTDLIKSRQIQNAMERFSVGTVNTEFYPFYGGVGNAHNGVRKAHREALSVMAFLSIPKTTRQYAKSKEFRKFRRQLFHSSIARILQPLKPHMIKPRITRCTDGHFRRTIYGLGPYIADYPEQALLTCIVKGHCPRLRLLIHVLLELSDVASGLPWKLGRRYWARIRETARREVGGGPHFILRETRYMSLYFQMALQGLQLQNQEPPFRIQVLVTTSQTFVDDADDTPAKEPGLYVVGVNDTIHASIPHPDPKFPYINESC
ncbi:hypothetical protein B0H14DRAFT_3855779 [Mycena olivaceomarginata]|nr:hypothetical protein B0H14DRAFT_3855779 [Mycena olivaceomarginata]